VAEHRPETPDDRGAAGDLAESEAELRALLASMEDVILVLDVDGRYRRIAPTNPDLLYRPRAELLGRRLHDVFPPPQADAFLARIRECVATRRTLRFEYDLDIGGTPMWFATTVSPMSQDAVVWVARDVTAARQAAVALRESEERWRRISEATFEGIGFSENGRMVDVNAQLARMLGYEPEELIGIPVEACVAPEDRERVRAAIRSGRTTAYEHLALRKDGSVFPVEARGGPVTIGERALRVAAVRDLSARKRLEAELRQRETLAAMGSLVAGVAHEARTPLFSISATLDALDAQGGSPPDEAELRRLLRSQVRRLSALMQELLDYGSAPRLRVTEGALPEALVRAVRACGEEAGARNVRLRLEAAEGLAPLRGDVDRLQQAFQNVILNAVQHSPSGGAVFVRLLPEPGPPEGVVCEVADEGPGVPREALERLFEPFFTSRPGGTGMGLPIAQRFVLAHGGTIAAANRPGGGTVFTTFLPRPARPGGVNG
jgi:PAS domain S-box-containing protein